MNQGAKTTWAVALLLFGFGFALGQGQQVAKSARYEQPATISRGEWAAVNASLETLRQSVPYNSYGIGAPLVFYEQGSKKAKAYAGADWPLVSKKPVGEIRSFLLTNARMTFGVVQAWFPGITEADFEMEFYDPFKGISESDVPGEQLQRSVFAVFKGGELILKR